ncbi:ATP-binding protein [Miniphocaeibacter halophilus]|uniref:ATP-binding protein n=1 Tax=Miniphocaeibacter halophilus TaxID=2931922 RepID=A0AC61MRA2_9FIRM|nr:ATP-binding protein [Miniphocaeibacter halophilus]QQK08061.1 ATP-binding protein [Miniphocaeibacter halophilus]
MNDFIYADKKLEKIRHKNNIILEKRKAEINKKIPEYRLLSYEIKLKNLELINIMKNGTKEEISLVEKDLANLKNNRKKLLVNKGFPTDYLDKIYSCNICKDEGEINGKICVCKRNIINRIRFKKANMYQAIDTETFENFDFSLFREEKKENEQISPREVIQILFKKFKEYSENFSIKSKSLYISGDVGVGKTYICNSISSEVIKRGYNVVYMTASDLMQQLRANQYDAFNRMVENREKYNLIVQADLLIIDDLGTEYITDQSVANLFNLLNTRIIQKKPIIISTNIGFNEISRVYDERIYSRIKDFEKYKILGDDLRGKK